MKRYQPWLLPIQTCYRNKESPTVETGTLFRICFIFKKKNKKFFAVVGFKSQQNPSYHFFLPGAYYSFPSSPIMSKRKASDGSLAGMNFAITGKICKKICFNFVIPVKFFVGTLSVPRATFEAYIIENGGQVAKSVTNSVTHLISAETATKKCQDAEAKGVKIVDEEWVRNLVDGKGSSSSTAAATVAPPAKKVAAAPAPAAKKAAVQVPVPAPAAAVEVFAGLNFNVTGSADFKGPLEELITSNGGKLVTLGAACDYLVCPEEAMDKLAGIARSKGMALVNDQWVMDHVVSGEHVAKTSAVAAPAPVAAKATKAIPAPVAIPVKAVPVPVTAPVKAPAKAKAIAAPAAKAKAVPAAVAAAGGKPLAGMTICITGTLSEPRAAFEAMLVKHGASVAKTVTNSVTHLISAETGTKKCQDAEAKGVKIVDEDWIRGKISGDAGDEDEEDEDNEDEDEGEEDEEDENGEEDGDEEGGGDASKALEGMCFAITGKKTSFYTCIVSPHHPTHVTDNLLQAHSLSLVLNSKPLSRNMVVKSPSQ